MSLDIEKLGEEALAVLKAQLASLGADLKDEIEPKVRQLGEDMLAFGVRYAKGEDVAEDMSLLTGRAKMLAMITLTKTQNKAFDTFVAVVEMAARMLGVALKAAT